jgi:UDP-N-acetylmuramyl tripeptide synthase
MHIISLWIGKTTLLILRLFKRRGAALPGLVVEKLDAQFLAHMLAKIPEGVIVVSGTNGKTTSTKMLSAVLEGSGKKVLTNPTGSNFTRGVIASIITHASWNGSLDYDIAVLELDEAYAAKFVQQVSPRISLILNVMRDQMDRFGEIDYTANLLRTVVEKTTEVSILNRDDARILSLQNATNAQTELFGVAPSLRDIFRSDDELHGEISQSNLPALCELQKIDGDKITITIEGKRHTFTLSLYGVYNAQNATAVITACTILGMHPDDIGRYLADVTPAFGRGERIYVGSKRVVLQLVKNPGGFRHALIGAVAVKDDHTMIAINDDYADGRDVSWLWDVDFSMLKDKSVSTSGVRAADMALRLQYEDISVEDYTSDITTSLKDALLRTPEDGTLHIFTTYTAMLKIRQQLSSITEVEKV